MAKSSKLMRTYTLPHHANAGKVARVAAVLPAYQQTCKNIQAWQYQRLCNGDGLWNRANPKHIDSELSERYKRSALNQVVEGLSSWEAITQDHFYRIVRKSALPTPIKHDLYQVNRVAGWYAKTLMVSEPIIFGKKDNGKDDVEYMSFPIPPETLALARKIVKHIKKHKNSLPDLSKSRTMKLNSTVSQFEKSKTSKFGYWVRISTLVKGDPVWLPLQTHHFAEEGPGDWTGLTQVTVDRDGSVTIKQVKSGGCIKPRKVPENGCATLGLDRGIVTLFATSEGDLLGRSLYLWLKERDVELMELTKRLQKQGIKLSDSKRYKALQRRISEYIDNEVNRVLNRVVALRNPAEIVVESLDFRGSDLSKRMNRLLSRCGQAAAKTKLESLHETLGITITYVRAEYSSRECSGCGYVDERNRKSQDRFVCGFCGKTIHADINASHTVRARRSWPDKLQYGKRTKLLDHADSLFETRWGVNPNMLRNRNGPARKQNPTPKHRPADMLNVPGSQPGSIAIN